MSTFATPYEKFNVFDEKVRLELERRRLSDNLVEIRTPFLRYTTTVEFPTAEWISSLAKLGDGGTSDLVSYMEPFNLQRYDGCKFFTLGVHGLDENMAQFDSMYGVQDNSGLIVGITYDPKDNKQVIVRTSEQTNRAADDTRFDSPQSFPPPGIESATVERLRNGNVLKFTVNTVCYTKQQLDFLDMLAFSPGMTCILEWGNIISTPYGDMGLQTNNILNFKNVQNSINEINEELTTMKGGIRRDPRARGARSKFIDKWCRRNNFNYDFAIARIANVKTEISENKYKTTVIAYGVADNILHISAYATNNPDIPSEPNNQNSAYITSIREYFAPRSKFLNLLDNLSLTDFEIVKFDEPDNAAQTGGPAAPAGSGTPTNDIGQEQTFYITLNKFIDFFVNNPEDGIAKIVNAAVHISDTVNSRNDRNSSLELLVGVTENNFGYNDILRSTDPSAVLIVNPIAMTMAESNTPKLVQEYLNTVAQKPENKTKQKMELLGKLQASAYRKEPEDGNPSGFAPASKGIWLNSKMIQEVFLQARTFHEAIETILTRLNSATEGYWDLSLMFDEEHNTFRIVDGNLKMIPTTSQPIYTFNKRIPNNPNSNSVEGPEILELKINLDYPKLLVSQLGISALGNSSGNPDRKDLNFARNPLLGPRLPDIFRKDQPSPTTADAQKPQATVITASTVDEFVKSALANSMYDFIRVNVSTALNTAGFTTLPDNTRQALTQVFAIQRPLTPIEAQRFLSLIQSDDLTISQVSAIKQALGLRSIALINKAKNSELKAFSNLFNTVGEYKEVVDPGFFVWVRALANRAGIGDASEAVEKIAKSIADDKKRLLEIIKSRSGANVNLEANPNPNELRPVTQPAGGLPGAIR